MAVVFGGKKGPSAAAKPSSAKGASVAGTGRALSLLPEDWVTGGLLDDVDVTLTDLTWVDDWTYGGKVETPVLALRVTLKPDDGEEVIQYFSGGDLDRIVPSADGKSAIARVENTKGLNNNTNATTFLQSIIDAGFPKNKIEKSVDVFENLYCHVNRIAQKKRTGLVNADDKVREVLTVTKILRLPGEAKGKTASATAPKGKAMAAAAGAGSGANGDSSSVDADVVVEIINAVLEDKGGTVAFKALSLGALKHLAGNDQKSAIIAELKNHETLTALAEAGAIGFDGDTVTTA